ncbi:MAG: DNA-processing protein DprA [Desulfobulbaceae bacterium]|nr:DNA-processing protein DprA [Desulfobulbaceae bacterium]
MSNVLTDDTKAIILLCGTLGKDSLPKPLAQAEYISLVRWLISQELRPSSLLSEENIHEAATGSGLDVTRLTALLARGVQLGFAVEEWQSKGIWIVSRSDSEYPARYKKHLGEKAPPLLFGVGPKGLLNGGGLAIVGSRNVDIEGEDFTRSVAGLCADNRMPVVSGGARGVDQIAMTAALAEGGIAIGVIAENLLKKSLERDYRNAISGQRLLLISPYHPNARFTVWAAMARNKLIYAMADYGLVVSAEHQKGGTWTGAKEELRREKPIPVFVRSTGKIPAGNKKLLDIGAIKWPSDVSKANLKEQLEKAVPKISRPTKPENMSIFDIKAKPTTSGETRRSGNKDLVVRENAQDYEVSQIPTGELIYHAVMPIIIAELSSPITPDELSKRLNVSKSQLNAWLNQAVEDKKIYKLSRPVRFCTTKDS